MNKIQELEIIKNIFKINPDKFYLKTRNKETGHIGCASFYTNGEQKIMVYEGNPDGSDDRGYTYKDFIEKYTYQVKREK